MSVNEVYAVIVYYNRVFAIYGKQLRKKTYFKGWKYRRYVLRSILFEVMADWQTNTFKCKCNCIYNAPYLN